MSSGTAPPHSDALEAAPRLGDEGAILAAHPLERRCQFAPLLWGPGCHFRISPNFWGLWLPHHQSYYIFILYHAPQPVKCQGVIFCMKVHVVVSLRRRLWM